MTELGCHMHLIGFKGNKIISVFFKKGGKLSRFLFHAAATLHVNNESKGSIFLVHHYVLRCCFHA